MQGKLFVISAPSGAGKTSLVNALLHEVGDSLSLKRVITYTTRPMGPGEQAGIDYHFISVQEFERKIQQGEFLEWSIAYGTYYGSPASIIDWCNQGASYTLIVDRLGAQAIRARMPDAVFIWIYTKGIDVLRKRLVLRGRDSQEKIEKRLLLAEQEMIWEEKNHFFSHHIDNDVFKVALNTLKMIVCDNLLKNYPKRALEADIDI